MGIWALIACASAVVIISQLGQQTFLHSSSGGGFGIIIPALNYFLNLTLTCGTPYLAWYVGAIQGPVSIANYVITGRLIRVLIVLSAAASALSAWLLPDAMKGGALWSFVVIWWITGFALLPRSRLEAGHWWLRAALASKLVEVLPGSF
ncbi:hypothetical protein AAE478_006554 [Parahypoxylon ruwenzoriense]